jgi:hypothetical protein
VDVVLLAQIVHTDAIPLGDLAERIAGLDDVAVAVATVLTTAIVMGSLLPATAVAAAVIVVIGIIIATAVAAAAIVVIGIIIATAVAAAIIVVIGIIIPAVAAAAIVMIGIIIAAVAAATRRDVQFLADIDLVRVGDVVVLS